MELKALKAEFKRPTSDARSSSQTHQARVILRKAPAAVRRRIPGFRRPVSMKGFGDELLDYITGRCSADCPLCQIYFMGLLTIVNALVLFQRDQSFANGTGKTIGYPVMVDHYQISTMVAQVLRMVARKKRNLGHVMLS